MEKENLHTSYVTTEQLYTGCIRLFWPQRKSKDLNHACHSEISRWNRPVANFPSFPVLKNFRQAENDWQDSIKWRNSLDFQRQVVKNWVNYIEVEWLLLDIVVNCKRVESHVGLLLFKSWLVNLIIFVYDPISLGRSCSMLSTISDFWVWFSIFEKTNFFFFFFLLTKKPIKHVFFNFSFCLFFFFFFFFKALWLKKIIYEQPTK